MAKHILVVISNSSPGQEDEFNRWYTEQHLDDVLRVPGFVAAQRFKLSIDGPQSLSGRYLSIYEMDIDDPKTTFDVLAEAVQAGQMPISSALDTQNLETAVFTPITERKVRKP
jgi:hypothetical protein